MTKATELNERLQQIIDFVAQSIQNVKQDNLTDMKAMDAEVAAVCSEIENAGKEVAEATEGKMVELIGLLDQLALEIDDYKNRQQAADE